MGLQQLKQREGNQMKVLQGSNDVERSPILLDGERAITEIREDGWCDTEMVVQSVVIPCWC